MWIRATSQLSENVYQIVTPASTHCLVSGEKIAIVDTGLAALEQPLLEELAGMLGSDRSLDYVFLTHSHFDHIGAFPILKRFFSNLKLYASSPTAELLKDKNYLQYLYRRNAECATAFDVTLSLSEQEWISLISVDHVVADGDTIELGDGVIVKVVSCPGHTKEQLAYFVPSDNAIAGGEAFGFYNGRDKNYPAFTSSYKEYIESLDKAARLDVRVLGFPHNGALTGDLAQKYLLTARIEAETFYNSIKERLGNGELVDEIVGSILPDWRAENICPEGPFIKEQEETLKGLISAIAAS